MSTQPITLIPAAVRLGELLDGTQRTRKSFALQLGMTAEWLSKHTNQKVRDPFPVETLMLAAHILRGHVNRFEELFRGTIEYDAFMRRPAPERRIVRGLAELNVERLKSCEPIITRKNIRLMLADKVKWPRSAWTGLLTGDRLPEKFEERLLIANAIGVPARELRYDGEVLPGDLDIQEMDWFLIDRLVYAKLRNPNGLETKFTDAEVEAALQEYLREKLGDTWDHLADEVRESFLNALIPVARQYFALTSHAGALRGMEGGQDAQDVLEIIAGHLPPIANSLLPAASALRHKAQQGRFLDPYARQLDVPAIQLALLMLGMASGRQFKETAKKVRDRFPKR